MNGRTISVVMATHNGARYLNDQLESLANQTVLPGEIIISDDNSTDDTMAIVESFRGRCRTDVKIERNNPGLGFRENFLRAASKASGDFIAFCDQDDIWRDDKIEKCLPFVGNESICLIVHPAKTIDMSSRVIGEFRQGIRGHTIRPPLSYDLWGTFWGFSVTFRRSLLDLWPVHDRFIDYISPNHLIAHDRWITFLGQMVGATAEVDECLVAYRQHQNNLYGQGRKSKRHAATMGNLKTRSATYIEATLKMVDIASNLQLTHAGKFPLYDQQRCVSFIDRALAHLRSRSHIYTAETKSTALKQILAAAVAGGYKDIVEDRIRWMSLVRDLQFIALEL